MIVKWMTEKPKYPFNQSINQSIIQEATEQSINQSINQSKVRTSKLHQTKITYPTLSSWKLLQSPVTAHPHLLIVEHEEERFQSESSVEFRVHNLADWKAAKENFPLLHRRNQSQWPSWWIQSTIFTWRGSGPATGQWKLHTRQASTQGNKKWRQKRGEKFRLMTFVFPTNLLPRSLSHFFGGNKKAYEMEENMIFSSGVRGQGSEKMVPFLAWCQERREVHSLRWIGGSGPSSPSSPQGVPESTPFCRILRSEQLCSGCESEGRNGGKSSWGKKGKQISSLLNSVKRRKILSGLDVREGLLYTMVMFHAINKWLA